MSVFDDMVKFLDTAWCAKDNIVPCLIGGAGIGKTAAVQKHAENVKAGKVVTIIASQILPNEVSGITMPVNDTHSMEIYDHYRLSSLQDGDILFFDELLEADQLVLSACLTLIESRQMMSGKLLPDIQIVAATNPTIKPNMLKENIRQRFLFRSFDIDGEGTKEYILRKYGLRVSPEIINKLVCTDERYNILTPRSLTKMVAWITSAEYDDEASSIADQINDAWGSAIGSNLYNSWRSMRRDKDNRQILDTLCNVLREQGYETLEGTQIDDIWNIGDIWNQGLTDDDVSIEKIMEFLKKLPDWEEVESKLNSIEVEDCDEQNILF